LESTGLNGYNELNSTQEIIKMVFPIEYENQIRSLVQNKENINPTNITFSDQIKILSNQVVDVKCLPTGFSTSFSPSTNTCNYCYNILNEGEVLTCGHGYHYKCYDKLYYSCNHCKEYYKKGINYNVKMFIKCLEKGLNVLTNEKLQDKEESTPTADDSDDQTELESISEVHNNFVNALEAMSC
ncbi:5411_t:CDS:2, partial [Cetraspora pellucida]